MYLNQLISISQIQLTIRHGPAVDARQNVWVEFDSAADWADYRLSYSARKMDSYTTGEGFSQYSADDGHSWSREFCDHSPARSYNGDDDSDVDEDKPGDSTDNDTSGSGILSGEFSDSSRR